MKYWGNWTWDIEVNQINLRKHDLYSLERYLTWIFLANYYCLNCYLSRTNPNHKSFFLRLSLLMLWLVNAPCTLLLNYWVLSSSIMLSWFAYIQIPLELCFIPLFHYRNFFLFYAYTIHQAKSLTILCCFQYIILSLTLLYI